MYEVDDFMYRHVIASSNYNARPLTNTTRHAPRIMAIIGGIGLALGAAHATDSPSFMFARAVSRALERRDELQLLKPDVRPAQPQPMSVHRHGAVQPR